MDNTNRNSVLIVDDENANITALTHILSPEYTVYAAKNGRYAVKVAVKYLPDVILLDVLMPDMDGYEVLSELRKNEETRTTPVIFVTGLTKAEDEEKGLALGAVDYISKPFNPAIVRLRVRNQIRIREAEYLAKEKIAAQAANKAKSVFLANMSHEIRTPMNAILGITEIQLRNAKLPPDMEEALKRIYESGNLLLSIINDILDLSKIEAGRMEIVPVKYDIPSLVNDAVQLCRLRYDCKPIKFHLDIDENTPLYFIGDALRIKQILNNILSNAFKYTDKGEIKMSVWAEPSDGREAEEDVVTLVIRVSDTGQGMTAEQLNSLFDEYTRFNLEANRTTVGTGLGMSITKRLLDLMGGEIIAKSEPNQGSVFTARLPQKRVDSFVCGNDMAEKLRDFRFQSTLISEKSRILRDYMPYGSVLIVDDVESNLYVAKCMLLPYGLQIETASSGLEVIEKIKNGSEYDIIFMDHMMPKMDGIETTRIIRGMGYNRTIVAFSANALVGQSEVFMKNGFDGFISKPIDSRELDAVLVKFIQKKTSSEVVRAAALEQRGQEDAEENDEQSSESSIELSELKKYFLIDAGNAVSVLEKINAKINDLDEKDTEIYVVTVHGMKSALFNIGERALSDFAYRLEQAGKKRDIAVISAETPDFIDAVKSLTKKLKR